MGFLEDFQASLQSLPAVLQKNYGLVRDLDRSLQGVQQQNEERCGKEIDELRQRIESGSFIFDSRLKFSDEAIEEQNHCIRIADEKVALATQAYDLVDAHIQQLDQFMRKLEDIRKEKEAAVVNPVDVATGDGTINIDAAAPRAGRTSERGRGGRKKSSLPVETPPIDLEVPVDPNEPTYCLCNQVSYGAMVACDNPDCKIEWFHFGCVGLKEQPKGKWYCLSCTGLQKRRKAK